MSQPRAETFAEANAKLPELYELTVHMSDGMRVAGSMLSGQIIIGLPSRRSLVLLHGQSHLDQTTQVAKATMTPSSKSTGTVDSNTPLLSTSPSSSPSSLSSQLPLSKPFPFEFKLQLLGRAVCDTSKISNAALQQRFQLQPGGSSNSAAFKLWSTRIASFSISEDDCQQPFPRVYEFRVHLPDDLPPSFRGTSLSHTYFLHIIAVLPKSGGKKMLDLKVPFKVAPSPAIPPNITVETPAALISTLQHCLVQPRATHHTLAGEKEHASSLETPSEHTNGDAPTTPPRNTASNGTTPITSPHTATPLLSSTDSSSSTSATPSVLPAAPSLFAQELPAAVNLSRRNSQSNLEFINSLPLTFNISKTIYQPSANAGEPPVEMSPHVVKVTLDQRFLQSGDAIRGHLDFSAAQIRCYRVWIVLVQVEQVAQGVSVPIKKSSAAAPAAYHHQKTIGTFHTYTLHSYSSHFLFSLPVDAPSNWSTDLVSLKWELHFKFIVDERAQVREKWSVLPPPSTTKVEALHWTLPLQVVPFETEHEIRSDKNRISKSALFGPSALL